MRHCTLIVLFFFMGCGTGLGSNMEHTTDTNSWQTHCLGRYLIDVPSGSKTHATYKYSRLEIEATPGISEEAFHQKIEARVEAITSTEHQKTGTSMLVGETLLAGGNVLLTSWASPNSTIAYRQEMYLYLEGGGRGVIHKIEGTTVKDKQDITIRAYQAIANEFSYRKPLHIPTEPGLCINYGLIKSATATPEETKADISFSKPYDNVRFSILAYPTANPPEPLFERMDSVLESAAATFVEAFSQADSLRKRDRTLGGNLQGQELVVRSEHEGKVEYHFTWQSSGEKASMSQQRIVLDMTIANTDVNGDIVETPFDNDAEALAFWDALLESFHLRPGAV